MTTAPLTKIFTTMTRESWRQQAIIPEPMLSPYCLHLPQYNFTENKQDVLSKFII